MKREAETQKTIDEETAKAEKAALGAEMISNIEQNIKTISMQISVQLLNTKRFRLLKMLVDKI